MKQRSGALWRFVRSAPLTFGWLAALLLTSMVQHAVSPERLQRILEKRSTNLIHLASEPLRVLFSSLLWIDGAWWSPYLVLFCLFLVPAERWLGSLRWLAVGLLAHVIGTYVGEGALYLAIQQAAASPKLLNARDVGVSYFLAGIVGVLCYRFVRPARWVYLGLIVGAFGVLMAVDPDFTAIGHFTAMVVGLACYPLTLGRHPVLWDPVRKLRSCVSHRPRRHPPAAVRGTGAGGLDER